MFDYAIKNGLIVDGTGAAPYQATLYIEGEKIAKISKDDSLAAKTVIDASGLAVAPGFIDMHTHSDVSPYCAPDFETALTQGITFHLAGNCGGSMIPEAAGEKHGSRGRSTAKSRFGIEDIEYRATDFASYRDEINENGIAINFSTLIGHGRLRGQVMAESTAVIPTEEEMQGMEKLLDTQLSQGALGLSFGLTYIPGTFSKTEELIRLAKVVAKHNALISVHMRSEGAAIFEALDEMGRVSVESGAHVHISHFKLMLPPQWGKADELLAKFDEWCAKGAKFTADAYPYLASSTGARSLMPLELKKSTKMSMEVLGDDEKFETIREHLINKIASYGGPDRINLCPTNGKCPEALGKNIAEIAALYGVAPEEAYRKVMYETGFACNSIFHAMCEEDTLKIAKRMDVAVISDGFGYNNITVGPNGMPHPRSAGSHSRFLRLAREKKLMPLEKAIYKMTALPASIMQIANRGVLAEGNWADVTVFDPENITDCATFEQPALPAKGVHYVFVNGTKAFENGKTTGSRTGRVLSAGGK